MTSRLNGGVSGAACAPDATTTAAVAAADATATATDKRLLSDLRLAHPLSVDPSLADAPSSWLRLLSAVLPAQRRRRQACSRPPSSHGSFDDWTLGPDTQQSAP